MNKEEHIEYWLNSSKEDYSTMLYLFDGGKFVHALFFGHLFLEKIAKALWVAQNETNNPPYSHNLTKLLNGLETGLTDDQMSFLDVLNVYQLKGRYPDYSNSLSKQTDQKQTLDFINKIKSVSECLHSKI